MARLPRFVILDQPQHVIARGNDRQPIFYTDADYRFYLEKLKQACDKHQSDVHAYVLMTNHIHLLMTPHTEQTLVKSCRCSAATMFNISTIPMNEPVPFGRGAR
ncbi:MAG: transposase [Porticoccus sp.]|nr:transposase [Porticoccus sp.]MBQ0808577.1 transposase [Porticoccus sp.]